MSLLNASHCVILMITSCARLISSLVNCPVFLLFIFWELFTNRKTYAVTRIVLENVENFVKAAKFELTLVVAKQHFGLISGMSDKETEILSSEPLKTLKTADRATIASNR
jgi:hypothetical protein